MAKRRMMVQIIPRVILTLPSTISMGDKEKKRVEKEEIEDKVATANPCKTGALGNISFYRWEQLNSS